MHLVLGDRLSVYTWRAFAFQNWNGFPARNFWILTELDLTLRNVWLRCCILRKSCSTACSAFRLYGRISVNLRAHCLHFLSNSKVDIRVELCKHVILDDIRLISHLLHQLLARLLKQSFFVLIHLLLSILSFFPASLRVNAWVKGCGDNRVVSFFVFSSLWLLLDCLVYIFSQIEWQDMLQVNAGFLGHFRCLLERNLLWDLNLLLQHRYIASVILSKEYLRWCVLIDDVDLFVGHNGSAVVLEDPIWNDRRSFK